MKAKYLFYYILAWLLTCCTLHAQNMVVSDTNTAPSPKNKAYTHFETIYNNHKQDSTKTQYSSTQQLINHPNLGFKQKGIYAINERHLHENKDLHFYIIVAFLCFAAIIFYFFDWYIKDVWRLLFNPANKLYQTNENSMTEIFPSFMLNILFIITSSFFIAYLSNGKLLLKYNLWQLWSIAAIALSMIYLFKYFFIIISGLLFNLSEAAKLYTSIVFLVNKIIGIITIPILFFVVFQPDTSLTQQMLTLYTILIILLYSYRYIISFNLVRRQIKISGLHFFMYLCSAEILPMLVIYKFLTEKIILT